MGRSNFKNIFLQIRWWIRIPLEKVCTQSVLHFQIFRSEVVQKLKKPLKLRVSLTYPQKMSFLLIWPTSSGNFKKIKVVCIHTFSRGIRICPQICNKTILKIDLPIGHVDTLGHHYRAKIVFNFFQSLPYNREFRYKHDAVLHSCPQETLPEKNVSNEQSAQF